MAIDFPNNPVNGSTYNYLGVTHTYVGTPPNGYWTVFSPGNVSVASIAEINAGTDPGKYLAPGPLDGSKYTREEETGQTDLTFNGLIKATTTGTGLTITGDIVADNIPSVISGSNAQGYWRKDTNDGFTVQWGRVPVSAHWGTIVFPISFTDIESLDTQLTLVDFNDTGGEDAAPAVRQFPTLISIEWSAHSRVDHILWKAIGY